jgi:Xaa-Pro aminopeptidase
MKKRSENYSQQAEPFDFLKRIQKLERHAESQKVDGCVIDQPIDIFYLTGLELSLGRLIAVKGHSALFVDGRYFAICKERSPIPVLAYDEESIGKFLSESKIKTLGFDAENTSFRNYEKLSALSSKHQIALQPLISPLRDLRLFKDPQEIVFMKKSALILWKGFEHIEDILKEGMTEKEVAFEFEFFCRKNGAEELSFPAIIAFGENSAHPHHHCSDRAYRKGDVVLIDIGVKVDRYCSDMTRMLLRGDVHPDVKQFYKIVRQAQAAALALCRPGVALKELDLAARAVMKEAGVENLFVHSLGHGIGLEVHEYPRVSHLGQDKDLILAPNMVITIEPGLYQPGIGGVRYEDIVLITEKGHENFYPESP